MNNQAESVEITANVAGNVERIKLTPEQVQALYDEHQDQCAAHTIDINAINAKLLAAESDRDYWKRCAEKAGFIDC